MAFYGTPNGIQFSVLIVEDDAFFGELLRDHLQKSGFQALLVGDGEEAVHFLADHTPHGVILDIGLPKKNGFEVLDWLSGHPEKKSIPVVILTNSDQKEDLERALHLGAKEYIVKTGSTPAELIKRLTHVLHTTYL